MISRSFTSCSEKKFKAGVRTSALWTFRVESSFYVDDELAHAGDHRNLMHLSCGKEAFVEGDSWRSLGLPSLSTVQATL
jgi:hypothetical protein